MKNKKKLKYILAGIIILVLAGFLVRLLLNLNSFKGEIDRIEILLSDEKTNSSLKSKTIKDADEINLFINALNSAKITKKVNNEKVNKDKISKYLFYEQEDLIKSIIFTDNSSEKIVNKDQVFIVKYKNSSLYDLYKSSKVIEKEIQK